MMMKGIQYATFQTGSKVGSITKDGVADQIYNDETDQKTLKSDIEFTPNVVYLEYLKNVTSVPNKFKKKTVFSTQLRKLILEGLYEQGLITYDNIKDAVKEYEDTVDAYSEILKIQLLEEIGYEYVDGKYIGNLGDFLKVVRNELERRELPEHHIKFINVNENNTIKTDLSLHLEADEIEKIVLEEMSLAAVPTTADEKRKYDNLVVQYESAITLLRELLNHTFLRAIYHTSSRQAQNEYKEVQRTFVAKNSLKTSPTVCIHRGRHYRLREKELHLRQQQSANSDEKQYQLHYKV